jgi:hypothetical protein
MPIHERSITFKGDSLLEASQYLSPLGVHSSREHWPEQPRLKDERGRTTTHNSCAEQQT